MARNLPAKHGDYAFSHTLVKAYINGPRQADNDKQFIKTGPIIAIRIGNYYSYCFYKCTIFSTTLF